MAASSEQTCGADLSDDLVVEILKRLPVVSLCRFRCVCKAWNSLFSSRGFIALHHNCKNSSALGLASSDKKSYFGPHGNHRRNPSYALYHPPDAEAELIGEDDHEDDGNVIKHLTYVHLPFQDFDDGIFQFLVLKVIGVIKGVVCLVSDQSTVFWNPTTHKYIVVHNIESWGVPYNMGFGFDAANNDFKVVMTDLPWYGVYSIDYADWWEAEVSSDHFDLDLRGCKTDFTCGNCFLNGRIHWIAVNEETRTCVLMVFDCESEQFSVMDELPQALIPDPYEWDGSINHLLLSTRHDTLSMDKLLILPHGYRVEMWSMEEYGVARSWKKLFIVNHDEMKMYQNIPPIRDVVMLTRFGSAVKYTAGADDGDGAALSSASADVTRSYPRPYVLNGQPFVESLFLGDVERKEASHVNNLLKLRPYGRLDKVYIDYVDRLNKAYTDYVHYY